VTRDDQGPLFVWDGDCGFCRFWVMRWRARLGEAVRFAPYQEVGERFPEISEEAFRRSAKLIEEDGTVREAAAAVCRLLSPGPGPGILWWLHRRIPPFRWTAEAAYRWIADHRELAARATRLLWGRDPAPPTFATTARLVCRAVALVYLVAFLSLAVQVRGLIGPEGVLPAGEYLDAVGRATGGGIAAVLRAPTLAWLAPGGGALVALCAAGVAASLALFLEVVPLVSAAAAWVLYLSLQSVGQAFLSFQWDILLLEAGFLLLFLVPAGGAFGPVGRFLPSAAGSAARTVRKPAGPWFPAIWLFWWLLFRLIFESGLVKLAGGDPVWRDLTALAHHYETQPIPNPLAWYAHQLPLGIHRISTLLTFVVELGVPFLFFLPRRPRMLGGLLVIAHQAAILLTGNYGFFNLLTIAVALCLFDDRAWRAVLERLPGGETSASEDAEDRWSPGKPPGIAGRLRRGATVAFLGIAVVVGAGQVVRSAGWDAVPAPVLRVWRALSPFGVLNAYGLFADMTTTRPEIVVEGRRGAGPWRELEFRWRPDDLDDPPPQVAPHQPRLDWQMWFAALRAQGVPRDAPARVRYDRWLLSFVERLLAGTPEVWALLVDEGAFLDEDGRRRPPDRVRALLYDYRFTSREERAATGAWWSRRLLGEYLPPVRRTGDGRLEVVSR